jgi:hypothetical protein
MLVIKGHGMHRSHMRTALYRHFDSENRLLYVGISLHAVIRLAGHRRHARWFDEVATVTIEWFETRDVALKAEQCAILKERPRFNNGGRPLKPLTELFVKRVRKRGRYGDGDGLYLQVVNRSSKSWYFRYRWGCRERCMGLGSAKWLSLAEARERLKACQKLLLDGHDPIEEHKRRPWWSILGAVSDKNGCRSAA